MDCRDGFVPVAGEAHRSIVYVNVSGRLVFANFIDFDSMLMEPTFDGFAPRFAATPDGMNDHVELGPQAFDGSTVAALKLLLRGSILGRVPTARPPMRNVC